MSKFNKKEMIKTLLLIACTILISTLTYNKSSILPSPTTYRNKSTHSDNNGISFLNFDFTNCLRGISILMIMIGHISGTMDTVLFSPLGGTGVALFLFISGFGLNESFKKNGLKGYWKKKITRVLIPYFIVITILWIVKYDFIWWKYLLDIIGLKTHYWFIAYLIKWYIAFWLFSRFFNKHKTWLMVIIAIVTLFILPNIEAEQSFSFLVGYLASSKIKELRDMPKNTFAIIAIFTFIFATSFLAIKQMPIIRMHESDYIYNLIQVCIKLPYAVTIIALLKIFPKPIGSKFLLLTGSISYELYLVHMPFYSSVNGSLLYALILLTASYMISYIFNIFNKKISNVVNGCLCKV